MMSRLALTAIAASLLASCATEQAGSRVDNSAGRATVYEDARSAGSVQGIGVESQDIIGMSDKMVRDMLATPRLAGRATPPRVLIDSELFTNESSARVDKNQIVNKLRIQLSRAANGRMVFVGRKYAGAVEAERDLKSAGVVDGGTLAPAAVMGYDYRLVGTINSTDAVDGKTGNTSRYQTFTFEMLDINTSELVWGNDYEYRKTAQDDIIYR